MSDYCIHFFDTCQKLKDKGVTSKTAYLLFSYLQTKVMFDDFPVGRYTLKELSEFSATSKAGCMKAIQQLREARIIMTRVEGIGQNRCTVFLLTDCVKQKP